MTILMNAALPASATLVPTSADATGLPPGMVRDALAAAIEELPATWR